MASELCMNCFSVKGQYEVCPFCGYVEGTPPEQPHYLTPGTILGNHFIVGTVIGFGGFGITYKCFDSTLGVTVAVKEFYPMGLVNRAPGESKVGLLSGDKRQQYKEQLKRFLMEAQSVAQFGKAKDIVNVYDFFEENNTAYIIMEYIDGVLLKDYLEKQGAMHPDGAMSVIMPIIEAVKKIHSKGIIHCDISPDNIFIASEDSIKVFDFGAAHLNDSKEGMAAEKVIKVGYSAPEQYRDKSRQGFFTDIYSVGAILYQMLTGIKPIESTEREFKDVLKSPMELGVKINSNIDRAVMEALAVKPELRFQGIQHLEDALNSKRVAEYPKEKLKKRKRRRNWIIGLAATMVLAVGVGIGLYSTVLKPENPIFDSTVSEDTITVWVENNDQREQLEELVEDGFKQGEDSNSLGASEEILRIQQENEDISVEVTVHEDMEGDLEKAKKENAMPNMFLSDHVSNMGDYDLVSFEDNVYEAINKEDYLYMSQYESYFPGMKEMPTGIDTLLLYTCQFDYNAKNTLEDSAYFGSVEGNTIDLTALMQAENNGEKTKITKATIKKQAVFREHANCFAVYLKVEDSWNAVFDKKEIPDNDMRADLMAIQNINAGIVQKKYMVNDGTKTGIYGSNIVAGVDFRKKMNAAVDVVRNGAEEVVNPLKDYKPYVVTCDDKMLVSFSERYAILADSSRNQEIACMRLLWVMLSQKGQFKKTGIDQTSYPILSSSFYEFEGANGEDFKGFLELVEQNYPCIIVSGISGDIYGFNKELSEVNDDKDLQEYCQKYITKE